MDLRHVGKRTAGSSRFQSIANRNVVSRRLASSGVAMVPPISAKTLCRAGSAAAWRSRCSNPPPDPLFFSYGRPKINQVINANNHVYLEPFVEVELRVREPSRERATALEIEIAIAGKRFRFDTLEARDAAQTCFRSKRLAAWYSGETPSHAMAEIHRIADCVGRIDRGEEAHPDVTLLLRWLRGQASRAVSEPVRVSALFGSDAATVRRMFREYARSFGSPRACFGESTKDKSCCACIFRRTIYRDRPARDDERRARRYRGEPWYLFRRTPDARSSDPACTPYVLMLQ
jgi:hypothetical protein